MPDAPRSPDGEIPLAGTRKPLQCAGTRTVRGHAALAQPRAVTCWATGACPMGARCNCLKEYNPGVYPVLRYHE